MYFVIFVLCYLLGNINPAYIYGKLTKNTDIRNHGSGNAGTTNALRVLGKKAGAIVLIADFVKGIVAVLLAGMLSTGQYAQAIGAIAVILGHNWPVLLKFRGGKGIATICGVFAVLAPISLAIAVGIALALIFFTRMVSLGSIVGLLVNVVVLFVMNGLETNTVLAIVVATIGIFQHRQNIKRIIQGKENKFTFH
ncbi:MAG: glycerol-3-phosphate 1-O-acyltransferase PlsY [Eubacteriaceae bacterium]|jgi:glycerol-3-phosphate acyltransferase PlsY|nr:glycerol-3-phosphate 1-O-acyltransferase PlsY [Eubacteriaceae bacterium]